MQQMLTRDDLFAKYMQLTPAQQQMVVALVESLWATQPRNAERRIHWIGKLM